MGNVSAWWAIILIALLVSAASVAAEGSKGSYFIRLATIVSVKSSQVINPLNAFYRLRRAILTV